MSSSRTAVEVLHVDDDPALTELVAIHLERDTDGVALNVTTAPNADEGLSVLSDRTIGCIVSDYDMPERDGLDFLSAVRNRDVDVPFVLYTGRGSEEVAREAFRLGATDYMQKTVGPDQYALLANRIRNVVSGHRAAAASERLRRRTDLTDVVLDTSTTLMGAERDEIAAKIHWTLRNLGEALGADRASVFDAGSGDEEPEPEAFELTHEWFGEDGPPGERLDWWGRPEWFDRLHRFETVRIPHDDRPAGDESISDPPVDRSVLAVPMVTDWSLVGWSDSRRVSGACGLTRRYGRSERSPT